MAFYDNSKEERAGIVLSMGSAIMDELKSGQSGCIAKYFGDEDSYIRKSAYLYIGKIYFTHKNLKGTIISVLGILLKHENYKVRQTAINSAGEIGKYDFDIVQHFFDKGLFDEHHSPRNAVIGSVKKMGEVNPEPVLNWARKYLHHAEKEVRREICHGIELRGRKFPQDILPLLKELQHEKTTRVSNTLIHVLGQISYKKGCLQIVIEHLKSWENKLLVAKAIIEIIDVHDRYKSFSAMTQAEAKQYISDNYKA